MPYLARPPISRPLLLLTLVVLAWGSAPPPAQATRAQDEGARNGALEVVLETATRLDRNDPTDATDRVATGRVDGCRRVRRLTYRCQTSYDIRTYSLTEETERRTCTQTVGVTVSRDGLTAPRARVVDGLTCRDEQ